MKYTIENKKSFLKKNTSAVITLEDTVNIADVRKLIHIPRKKIHLLSMAGILRGSKDMSSNKKKYAY